MSDQIKPTSEWEHSHALESGDRLHDVENDVNGLVDKVKANGSVLVAWQTGAEVHTEEEIRVALRDGTIERDDGLSSELAAY